MSIEFSRKPTPASVGSPALVSPSTDNAIVRFDETAGSQQNSAVTIDDSNVFTHLINGDKFKLSSDPSTFRQGSWDTTTSGDLYTLVGELVMQYQSHNFSIDPATGNFNSRDEAGDHCQLYVFTETGKLKYYTTSNTTGVPSFVLRWTMDPTNALTASNTQTYALQASVADGASAVGFSFNNTNTLVTAGNRIVSFKNNGAERFYIYNEAGGSGFAVGSGHTTSSGGSAVGVNCVATASYALASGYTCTASNNGAVALGYTASATGLYSFASGGLGANATGSFATCLGTGTASGSNSVCIGTSNTASSSNAICIGTLSGARNSNTIVLGRQIVSQGPRSVSIGTGATSTGNRNTLSSTIAFFTNDAHSRFYFNNNRTYLGAAKVFAGTDTAVGSELIANGTFTGSAASWTVGAGWAYSANTMTYDSASGTGTLSQTFSGLTIGRVYRLSYTWSALTGSDDNADRMGVDIDLSAGGTFNNQTSPITTKEFFTADGPSHTITFTPTVTTGPLTGTLDNVSVQECQTGEFSIAGNFSARWASLGGAGAPTAYLTLAAGTTSNTPINIASGTLKTTPAAGDVEFVTDKYYATITTGAARKELTLNDAALTSGTFPIATTNGRLTNSSLTSTNLVAGTWTGTATSVGNLDSTPTIVQGQYLRIGNTVTCSLRFTADPTLNATNTSFRVSLPVASNFGNAEDCAGTAVCGNIAGMSAEVIADTTNDQALIQWVSSDTNSQTWSATFTYQVI